MKFVLCVWLAFVLMLTIVHDIEAKTLCLASIFAKKKLRLQPEQAFFFSSLESLRKRSF
jgi:hypothetical protein